MENALKIAPIVESCFPKLIELNRLWGFKLFETYNICLTKYGPCGTYNPTSGTVVMLTRKDGTFKEARPEETIIHEIVHIGIEESIIETFKLSHKEKEQLVDLMVKALFGSIFTNYYMQYPEATRMSSYINERSVGDIPAGIEKYIKQCTR